MVDTRTHEPRRRLAGEPLAYAVGTDPVADLTLVGPAAIVQTRGTDEAPVSPLEDAVRVVAIEVEPAPEFADQGQLLVDGLGLDRGPRHPGQEVILARSRGLLERLGILRFVATHDQTLGVDRVGEGPQLRHPAPPLRATTCTV